MQAGKVLSNKRSNLSRYMEQQTFKNMMIVKDATSWSITLEMSMEQHALKNVNNCLITNIYPHLETSGGQSPNLYLNVVHFFHTNVN